MKALNSRKSSKASQQGFTIIELVVVILLLGILTATALPRFMDVTDEAHAAVVDAVRGGLVTGNALFRAQYVGEGQPLGAVVAGFGAGLLYADAAGNGYPADLTDGIIDDDTECLEIYDGVLQAGRPAGASVVYSATPATLETAIEGAAAGVEFVITEDDEATILGCNLYYVGQFKVGTVAAPVNLPVLHYTLTTGEVTVEADFALNQN